MKRVVITATVEENTTVDSEADEYSGLPDSNNHHLAGGENFTDPIFESELAQFKMRLA